MNREKNSKMRENQFKITKFKKVRFYYKINLKMTNFPK